MIVALAVASAIVVALHRYVWARLVRDPGWPAPWGRGLGVAIVVLAVLVPLSFLAMRSLSRNAAAPLAWVVYPWLGLVFYLFLFTVLADVGRGLAAVAGLLPKDPERRQFLARAVAAGIAGAAGLVGV